jgi:hypothetical protein
MEWEVESIMGHKNKGRAVAQYLVRWKGYSSNFDSWEPVELLVNSQEAIDEYWQKTKGKRPLPPVEKPHTRSRGRNK